MENVIVVEVGTSLLPRQFVGVALANFLPWLELQNVEESLEDSGVLDDVEVLELPNFLLPLLWHQWDVGSSVSRAVMGHLLLATHGTGDSLATCGLDFVLLESLHLGSVLRSLVRCIESGEHPEEARLVPDHVPLSIGDALFAISWLSVVNRILNDSIDLSLVQWLVVLLIDLIIILSLLLFVDVALKILGLKDLPSVAELLDSSQSEKSLSLCEFSILTEGV